jgi:hypothetical protein
VNYTVATNWQNHDIRWRLRWAFKTASAALVVMLIAAVVAPLAVRGRLLSRIVARATESLCGVVRVEGGHLGWTATADLLLGRPWEITLDGVQVTAPDGRVVFSSAHLSAIVALHRRPWRITVVSAHVEHGLWRLGVSSENGSVGLMEAFRRAPARASRATCLAPPTAQSSSRGASGSAGGAANIGAAVTLQEVELKDMDVDLDFPTWALKLSRVQTHGSFSAGRAREHPDLLFNAHNATTDTGGWLRIGREGAAWTTHLRFDTVAIGQVAVTADAPSDLVLQVDEAMTGQSRLSGRAVFQGTLPVRSGGHTPPSGLILDARWDRVGDALSALQATWRPPGAALALFDGDVTVALRGPYRELSGEVRGVGRRSTTQLQAQIVRGGSLDADLRFAGFATTDVLDKALWPLLGGRLTGRVGVRAQFTPHVAGLAGVTVEMINTSLTLDRERRGPWPEHFVFRLDRANHVGSESAVADELRIAMGGARLIGGTLQLQDIRADTATLHANGQVTTRFPGAGDGSPTHQTHLAVQFDLAAPSLERLSPDTGFSGKLSCHATVTGSVDHLDVQIHFPRGSTVSFGGQRFVLPVLATAAVAHGDELIVSRFAVVHQGGGTAEASGRAIFDGPILADLRLHDYPVVDIPGLHRAWERVPLPAFLGDRSAGTSNSSLGGNLDGALEVRGRLAAPTVTGDFTVTDARMSGRPIGDGTLHLHAAAGALALDGTLGPGLSFRAQARLSRAQRLTATAALKLRAFSLDPWLPTPWARLGLSASGDGRVSLTESGPPRVEGSFQLDGSGSHLRLDGHICGAGREATIRGQVELGPVVDLWPWSLAGSEGSLGIDVATHEHGDDGVPLTGHIDILRDVVLHVGRIASPVRIVAGGRVDIDGPRLSTPGLTATMAGASSRLVGKVVLDPRRPQQTTLALTATGRLDAGALASRIRPMDSTVAISGSLDVQTQITGTIAQPKLDGEGRFADVSVRSNSGAWPAVTARGAIQAHGNTLSTRDLRMTIATLGALNVGSGTQPAILQIVSLWPLRLGRVDLPVTGRHLAFHDNNVPLAFADLNLDLRLASLGRGDLLLSGDVQVDGATLDRNRHAAGSRRRFPTDRWYQLLPPHFGLDLIVHGRALTVTSRFVPNMAAEFACRVVATAHGASLSGQLRGTGAYSRAALTLYDWVTPGHVRHCGILPPSQPSVIARPILGGRWEGLVAPSD